MQHANTDCAAACLAMVLEFHGRHVGISAARRLLPAERGGCSALAILDAGAKHELHGRGLHVAAADLRQLRPGSVLYVDGAHFVVFEASGPAGSVVIIDPAHGRLRLSRDEIVARFSGIAVELWPSPEFQPLRRQGSALARYLRPVLHRRKDLSAALAFSLVLVLLSLAAPLTTRFIIDDLIPTSTNGWALLFAAGVLCIALSQALTTGLRGATLVRLRDAVDRVLMSDLVHKLLSLPYSFFQRRPVGDLVMRLGSTAQVREVLTGSALSAVLDGGLVVIYLAVLTWLSPMMAAAAVGLAALQVGLFLASRRPLQEHTARYLAAEAESRGYQTRMLIGIEALKAMGATQEAESHFASTLERVLAAGRRRGTFAARFEGVAAGLRALAPLTVLGVGAYVVLEGGMSMGEMLGSAQLAAMFLVPMSALVETATQTQMLRSDIDRLEDIHGAPSERSGDSEPAAVGAVELHNVVFAYDTTEQPCLRGIDLRVAPGQHIALVGPSGSGKSTVARILLGLALPQRGRVLIGGIELKHCRLDAVRRSCGIVTQDSALFSLTIAENIRLGRPDATDAQVQRAAQLAQVHDEIFAMPMGYSTSLSDGGSMLSGGQRQRLCLARALVREPKLLVLDEATSALDTIREQAIYRELATLGCTVITIAHRLSTVREAESIHVLEDGRIVESGRHQELVDRGGHYRNLLHAQFGTRELRPATVDHAQPRHCPRDLPR